MGGDSFYIADIAPDTYIPVTCIAFMCLAVKNLAYLSDTPNCLRAVLFDFLSVLVAVLVRHSLKHAKPTDDKLWFNNTSVPRVW